MTPHNIKRGISIYSFQEKYYRGELSLEGCIATASQMGVRGIEMLPDQMIPGYPSITFNLSDEFIAQWREWLVKYGVSPIAFDAYGETKLYKHRPTTHRELLDEMVALLKTAHVLGFKILRLVYHLPIEIAEELLPYAEASDIKLAIEVHAPHLLTGEWVQRTIELAQRKNTRHLGLMPDLGIFCKTVPRPAIGEALREGAHPEIVKSLEQAYRDNRYSEEELMAKVRDMGGNDIDEWLALRVSHRIWTYHDPKHLLAYMPFIFHIHGKFYEMNEHLVEQDVDYESVMPALIEGGFDGYIMSEYEGQRLTHGVAGYDEIEQVRRHQAMLASYLGQ